MIQLGAGVYNDVVEIDENTFSKQGLEGLIHEHDKDERRIFHTKVQDLDFKADLSGKETGLWYIFLFEADLIIAGSKVNFAEET